RPTQPEDISRTVVLLGKTGHGKSTTGNTLLGVYRFEEGQNTMSETKSVLKYTVKDTDNYKLTVFDTPGPIDHAKEVDAGYTDFKRGLYNMDIMMEICQEQNYEIHAFFIVLNVTGRFSAEEQETIHSLEMIFGSDMLEYYSIIVLTHGDGFYENFDQWISKQTGPFKKLLNDCQNRVVLISNTEAKRKESRGRLIGAIEKLQKKLDKYYTHETYKSFQSQRDRFLLKNELPILTKRYEEEIKTIVRLRSQLESQDGIYELLKKIAVLNHTIKEKDKGTGLLKSYLVTLDSEYIAVSRMKLSSCNIF
ncbi:GTPase IMAP family member 4, partial [Biomphalaria glabrata]